MPSQLITIDAARLRANFNHSERFLILTMVQDWIFNENLILIRFQEMDQNTIARLEHACLELRDMIDQRDNRILQLTAALEHAEDANFALAAANAAMYRFNTRRVRRRLTYEEEVAILDNTADESSTGEETELEEHPEDVEL